MADGNNIVPRQLSTAEFAGLLAREQFLKPLSSNRSVRSCPDGSCRLPATAVEFG
jgi:hypothetical protein